MERSILAVLYLRKPLSFDVTLDFVRKLFLILVNGVKTSWSEYALHFQRRQPRDAWISLRTLVPDLGLYDFGGSKYSLKSLDLQRP
jgi:hypothetical protein